MELLRKTLCVGALISFLFFACGERKATENILAKIDSIADIHPKTALEMLNDIHNLDQLSRHDKVLYTLIYIKASAKNDEQTTAPEVVNFYLRAIDTLKNTHEYALLGRIYNELGTVNQMHNLFKEAISFHKKALEYNLKLKNKVAACNSLRHIGRDFLISGNNLDSAIYYMNKSLELSHKTKDNNLKSAIHNNFCCVYTELKDIPKALYHNNQALKLECQDSLSLYRNYLQRGHLLIQLNQLDSAEYYLKISSHSSNIYTRAASYFKLSALERIRNNQQVRIKYDSIYMYYFNIINRDLQTAEIAQIQYTFFNIFDLKKQRSYYLYIIFILLFVLLSIGIWLYHYSKIKQEQHLFSKEKEIQKHKEAIANKEKEIQLQKERLVHYESDKEHLEQDMIKRFKTTELYQKIEFINFQLENQGSKNEKKVPFLTIKEQEMLYIQIQEIFYYLIFTLNRIYPNFTQKDILLCGLIKMGISLRVCAPCLGTSYDSIRQRKKRIKDKLMDTPEGKELFYYLFPNEKE